MATRIYNSGYVRTIDGTELYVTPLKIKFLREFMVEFEKVREQKGVDDDIALEHLVECIKISMRQYCPSIKTSEDVEDNFDIPTLYEILNYAADISVSKEGKPDSKKPPETEASWESFDLASLEAEAFLLGIWKDYEELESSISLPELSKTLEVKRELEYSEKKFLAAMQGVDLDEQTGRKEENAWEKMKAKVFSKGRTSDPDDIVALQGNNAAKAGFGIGMGLSYEKIE
tara:strand:- start:3299 stop:3988 length:690 start_codon:yes stop_codon:yes gene_type:complete